MVTCKKCGSENIDNALFCKECGTPMNKFSFGKTITFKYTFLRLNIYSRVLSHIAGMLAILAFLFLIIAIHLDPRKNLSSNINYNTDDYVVAFGALVFGFFFMILSLVLFFRFNYRWKIFHIDEKYDYAKERVKGYVFKRNEGVEHFRIKETPKGELRLKDKGIGPRGYFHLLRDDDGNAIVIGEKYGAMNFIRSVFGKEINFMEN